MSVWKQKKTAWSLPSGHWGLLGVVRMYAYVYLCAGVLNHVGLCDGQRLRSGCLFRLLLLLGVLISADRCGGSPWI